MDQLAAIKVFVAIADAGSLSAAGRRLSMPLTTVSRHLAALEDAVGARLIIRTTRDFALTETGRNYLESCRRILAELDAARLRVMGEQDEPQGELAITAPVAFGRLHVLPIVTAFLKTSPRVAVRLLLIDRVVDLLEEGIDISLRVGSLPDSSLRAARVGAVRSVTCASAGYLAARGVPSMPRELAEHDCISVTALTPADRWVYSGLKASQRIAVRPRLIVNTAEAAIDAAREGARRHACALPSSRCAGRRRVAPPDSPRFRAGADPGQLAPPRGPASPGQGPELHRLCRAPAPSGPEIRPELSGTHRSVPAIAFPNPPQAAKGGRQP
jgi:DNA-binding transcriptional LysR family regulator